MIELVCEYCGKHYITQECWSKRTMHNCCSRRCADKLKVKLREKICPICGKVFSGMNVGRKKYCSCKCSQMAHTNKLSRICIVCGNVFYITKKREHTALYCSNKCRYLGTRKRINYTCTHCGKEYNRMVSWNNGNPSRFCSVECKNLHQRGKDHPNWVEIKNVRKEKGKLKKWSRLVKERDNYICQECGEIDRSLLHSHHIKEYKNYIKLRYIVSNGITLCKDCHAKYHKSKLHNLITSSNEYSNYKKTA